MLTENEMKKVRAARVTPEFLKSAAGKKAADEGMDMGLRISAPRPGDKF